MTSRKDIQSNPTPPARSKVRSGYKLPAAALIFCFTVILLVPERLPADIEPLHPPKKIGAPLLQAPPSLPEQFTAPVAGRPGQNTAKRHAADREKPFRVIKGHVARNHTFSGMLMRAGLQLKTAHEIVGAARPVFNLNRLKPGTAYTLALNAENEIIFLDYGINENRYLRVTRHGDTFTAELRSIEYQIETAVIQGTLRNNLVSAMQKAGGTFRMAMELAEIFSWDIDFFKDIRKGDRFKLIVEKKYRNGRFAAFGRILAATFTNRKRVFDAIYFESPGGGGNYYTAAGEPLQKQFLKSPLRFSRISSRYSHRRFHPIYKTYLPHLGVDYAAPTGTPVRAVSDGVVAAAAHSARAGNYIALRHNSIYRTSYSHLSRFARGIAPGTRVRQGQVIGYVGATGSATGPHLCFQLKKYGKPVNPLTFKSPGGPPIAEELRQAFLQISRRGISALAGKGAAGI